ncbi:amino acid adenylation domain-containing protein [Actinoplanes sp. NPDC049316]|uniref:amino acid adenylation domain-containing protein n=1 Tax=Actinoplanes sp. NPDC049316 TaxID=3154727 RepID=UPI00342C733D
MGLLHDVTAGHDPHRVAVRFRDGALTYGELDRAANGLAHKLRADGIGGGDVVGVLLDRGPLLPVARLAVLKAGAAWTPLDPQHPPARLAQQIGDAAAPLVLTSAALAGLVPPGVRHRELDGVAGIGADTAPEVDVRPADPAYLIYTSGSTGTPKGVLVPHAAASAYCRNAVAMAALTPDDRVAQVANPAFDMTVFDGFATLLAGATTVVVPRETLTDPAAFTALLRDERITFAYLPPAVLALLDPADLAGSDLRGLDIGGEGLSADLVNRWARPGLALHNSYGPTETTVVVTDHVCAAGPATAPPIGRALPRHRVYVLDARLRPAPIGIPGQLYVAGAGVAYGYLRRPGVTAQRFLPDPYGRAGSRMYATGDLARWRADGLVEFLGRTDRQVKLRGQRIELGEIEHALLAEPGIRQCAVVPHGGELAAYLVGDTEPGQARKHLAALLPPYMIPAAWTVLPELPLTPNGKVDLARLPEPQRTPRAAYVAPDGRTERWLADTWQELLGGDRVGAGDTLFALGANSLHTTQLVARVRDRFGVALHPRHLYADPTLAELAARIDDLRDDTGEGRDIDVTDDELDEEIAALRRALAEKQAARDRRARPHRPGTRDGVLPCSLQQEGLWFVQRLQPSSPVYHIGYGLRLRGVPDRAALDEALRALVRRHEALRTRFVEVDGVPRQVVDPPPDDRLAVTDVAPADVERWVSGHVSRPMDLAAGPLFRAALARVAPDEHVLMLVVHHIVADGWSVGILAAELSHLYDAAVAGTVPRLPELTMQPADHAAWQRDRLAGPERDRQLAYWREHLAGLATVDLPADRHRPAEPTGAGAVVARDLPEELSDAARSFARTHHVSFLAVFQAALLTVLHRYTGQSDLPIGSIFSGRTRTELEPVVGFLTNTVVLRTDAGGNPEFAGLVRRCHDTVVDATVHQDVPFGVVVDALQPERVAGRNPLFQISLTLQPGRGGGGAGGLTLGGIGAEVIATGVGHARFDLGIELNESPDGRIGLSMEYSTELFDADRIERLAGHYLTVLAAGLAAPGTPIAELDLIPAAERRRVLHGWNPPRIRRAPGLLHDVLAGHDPDRVAVSFGADRLTYGELDRRANRLAHALTGTGIGTGDVVGLLLDRGPHLVVAQFAVLKAGAAWMPLDPQHPPARLAAQLDDAGAPLVLTTTALALPGTRHWCLDEREFTGPDTPPATVVRPEDPAYLLYTSGSTGTPKGVLVPHGSAYAYCRNAVELFGTGPADRVAQISNPAFDAGIFDLFATLLGGATMIGAARETVADPEALTALLCEQRVTLAYLPPAILGVLDPARLAGSALRAAFSAAEALPADLARRWSRPGLALHNSYGPTETTVVVSDHLLPPVAPDTAPPIGRALPGHRMYVLDGRLQPAPIGVPGQLYLAGTGVAHGYLRRPGLTASRFVADPYGEPGERMYASGDLARWRADGQIEFLGRTDRQVKLRGQRIEPGEIEHALVRHPAVRQAVVTVHRGTTLAAYLVGDPDLADVREHLTRRLPTYMIPTAWVLLPALPLTPNGKLDLAALPDPVPAAAPAFVAPRTPTERWLAGVWEDLLGTAPIGAGADFFGLGGNSLQVGRLIARVREHLGIDLPPQHLFASPVLEELAARLDRPAPRTAATDGTGLVALRTGGDRPPLFLVHPAGGSVVRYVRLASLLGDDRPVYALESGAVAGSIAERAARYAGLVRRQQPRGPYHLAGWSLGGVIAQEMARQLGDAVLIAVDSGFPPDPAPVTEADVLAAFVRDLADTAGVAGPAIDLTAVAPADHEDIVLATLEDAGVSTADLRDELRTRFRAYAADVRAFHEHRPGGFAGRAVLIRAAESSPADFTMWKELCPGLEELTSPGDHFTMVQPPHVEALAAMIRRCLGHRAEAER